MKRIFFALVGLTVFGGIMWLMIGELETGAAPRDEPPAVILRAPAEFDVENMGPSSIDIAARAMVDWKGNRIGFEWTQEGDRVILLVDREAGKVIEMRAARSGTIVERTWEGDVEQRLLWAAQNGNLDAPGLPSATGKNLYH